MLESPDTRMSVSSTTFPAAVCEHNLTLAAQTLPEAQTAGWRSCMAETSATSAQIVRTAVRGATEIYHLAAQVAVTTSVEDPQSTTSVSTQSAPSTCSSAARRSGGRQSSFLLYTSTNKVYGGLDCTFQSQHHRVRSIKCPHACFQGVNETAPLDFHSPYGCSKGAADQYVRDYARIYGLPYRCLPHVLHRRSTRKFGNEDQGWVAHFLYSVLAGSTVNDLR